MSDNPSRSESTDDDRALPNGQRLVHDEVQYEQEDLRAMGIVWVLLGIALVFIGVGLVSWWLLNLNESDADRAAQAAQYSVPGEGLPAAPQLESLERLETTPASDVFAKQLELEHKLHGYGKTNENGFVHIPIDRAMQLAVEAMPVRKESAPPAKGFGLAGGGESNSGRMYSEAPSWLQQK